MKWREKRNKAAIQKEAHQKGCASFIFEVLLEEFPTLCWFPSFHKHVVRKQGTLYDSTNHLGPIRPVRTPLSVPGLTTDFKVRPLPYHSLPQNHLLPLITFGIITSA